MAPAVVFVPGKQGDVDMIRTLPRRNRVVVAVAAGLLAGLFVPGAAPTLVPAARAAVGPGPRIYVFPFQPVFKDVPEEIHRQATELLKNELKHSKEVRLQKGPIFIPKAQATQVKPLSDKELKQARKLQQQGEQAYQQLAFEKAARSFQAALGKYEQSLALLEDFEPVVDCLLMLSVCYYRTDKEKEGAKTLVKVIRLKPDLVLDPEKYPPMFRNTAEAIRKKLLLKSRGELEVMANVEDGEVFYDGRKVGKIPILLKELVPGEHFVRVEKQGLQPWADKVTVISTKRRKVLAVLGGAEKASGPLGEIATDIRQNRISSGTRKLAMAEGKKLEADYVVLGGVARQGANYKVGSFLLKVDDGRLCPLPEVTFDPDMLGASVEVYNMASVLYKRVEGCPDPVGDKTVAVVQAAAKKKTELRAVAVGPATPPPAARQPEKQPAAQPDKQPAKQPAVATGPATPARGPATPGAGSTAGPRKPAGPAEVATTEDGLATTGSSALVEPTAPVAAPIVPKADAVKPIDEQENHGPAWYKTWWFWTLVGAAVVGGTAGGMYAAGVFEGDSGASVTVRWPAP